MERKLKPRAEDTRSVHIDDACTPDFWAGEFNVSREKLKAAAIVAGNSVPDIKRELKK